MNKLFTYYVCIFFTLLTGIVQSQTQIEIINADEISFNKKISEDRQVLVGNVKTKHNNRFLTCDSAYYYAKDNKIEAFSNIHIWQGDTLSLKGDYLIYHGDHQLAEIQKNVRFKHNEMSLVSEQLKYNFEHEKGFFDEKALITENQKSLSSNKGIYYAGAEKFDFYTNVIVESTEEILRADTLQYWLNSEYAEFKSNGTLENSDIHVKANKGWVNQKDGKAFLSEKIQITDLENDYVLHADSCYLFNEMTHSISYGNTLLTLPLNEDTLYLTADTLIHQQKPESNLLKAYPNVSFKSSDLLGHCDSLSFITNDEDIFLNKTPVIWLDEFQVTADTIRIVLDEDSIKMALLNKNSFITSKIDSSAFNQISGVNMKAYFNKNELSNIKVEGNGESIYYVEDEKDNKPIGVNKIICSNMNIIVNNRTIGSINFYEKPDATLHPIDQITPEEFLLKGFKWRNKHEIMNKIESKIQRHYKF